MVQDGRCYTLADIGILSIESRCAVSGGQWRSRLVGRERELNTLLDRLEVTSRGEGAIALVAGEPGIGKTRLLAELSERARAAGRTALGGRAYDTEGMPPYLPFVEALRSYVRGT